MSSFNRNCNKIETLFTVDQAERLYEHISILATKPLLNLESFNIIELEISKEANSHLETDFFISNHSCEPYLISLNTIIHHPFERNKGFLPLSADYSFIDKELLTYTNSKTTLKSNFFDLKMSTDFNCNALSNCNAFSFFLEDYFKALKDFIFSINNAYQLTIKLNQKAEKTLALNNDQTQNMKGYTPSSLVRVLEKNKNTALYTPETLNVEKKNEPITEKIQLKKALPQDKKASIVSPSALTRVLNKNDQ